jgi:hypothetical protein
MGAEYELRVIDTAGATQAVITDYLSLAYSRRRNEPGMLSFFVGDDHPALSYLTHNNQVEVYRRNGDIGLASYRDFVGVVRGLTWNTQEATSLRIDAPGIMHALSWNLVGYPAGSANRNDFTAVAAETILKNLVKYNATASGTTADGRARGAVDGSGELSGLYTITLQADGAGGNTLTVSSEVLAWKNLLAALQDVALIAGGDFDLVKTAATTFEFRWYLGQRGTDRSASLTFSLDRGNMANPTFIDNRIEERTVAIVGGQDAGTARTLVTRTGDDYGATRMMEGFLNADGDLTTGALNAAGDVALDDWRSRPQLTFDVLQVPNAYYGVHYDLGDKVTAVYRGTSYIQLIQGVSIEFTAGGDERISVEMKTV